MERSALPAEVMATIGPAVEAIQAEQRAATDGVEYERLSHLAVLAARRAGGGGYSAGAAAILASAFPHLAPSAPEGDCHCEECEELECDGSCERCDDPYECQQHGCDNASSCCGHCSDCDSHHGDDANHMFRVMIYVNGGRYEITVCPDCEHSCNYGD